METFMVIIQQLGIALFVGLFFAIFAAFIFFAFASVLIHTYKGEDADSGWDDDGRVCGRCQHYSEGLCWGAISEESTERVFVDEDERACGDFEKKETIKQ